MKKWQNSSKQRKTLVLCSELYMMAISHNMWELIEGNNGSKLLEKQGIKPILQRATILVCLCSASEKKVFCSELGNFNIAYFAC